MQAQTARAISGHKASKKQTFDMFFSRIYLPHAKARKRSWQLDERLARRHLSPIFGHRSLAEITAFEVERWLTDLRESGLAPASCNRILAVFKSVCALAESFGYLPMGASPCAKIRQLKAVPHKDRFLSVNEGQRLMAYLDSCDRLEARVIELLLLTGARKSEILHAKWENLDLENRILTVPLSKSGKTRHIYLSEEAAGIFIRIGPKNDGWIFPGRKGEKPLTGIYHFWTRTRIELGLQGVRLHDLRHTYASYLVSAGHSLYEAQQLLGHSDPRMTMRYAHFAHDTLLKATASVARILDRSADRKGKIDGPQGARKKPHQVDKVKKIYGSV